MASSISFAGFSFFICKVVMVIPLLDVVWRMRGHLVNAPCLNTMSTASNQSTNQSISHSYKHFEYYNLSFRTESSFLFRGAGTPIHLTHSLLKEPWFLNAKNYIKINTHLNKEGSKWLILQAYLSMGRYV